MMVGEALGAIYNSLSACIASFLPTCAPCTRVKNEIKNRIIIVPIRVTIKSQKHWKFSFFRRSGAEQLRWRLTNINRAFCPKTVCKRDKGRVLVVITHRYFHFSLFISLFWSATETIYLLNKFSEMTGISVSSQFIPLVLSHCLSFRLCIRGPQLEMAPLLHSGYNLTLLYCTLCIRGPQLEMARPPHSKYLCVTNFSEQQQQLCETEWCKPALQSS